MRCKGEAVYCSYLFGNICTNASMAGQTKSSQMMKYYSSYFRTRQVFPDHSLQNVLTGVNVEHVKTNMRLTLPGCGMQANVQTQIPVCTSILMMIPL